MKILFFWPGIGGKPTMGLSILQSILKQSGHEVDLFSTATLHSYPRSTRGMLYKKSNDKDSKPDEVEYNIQKEMGISLFNKKIAEFRPDLICFSSFSTNYLIGIDYLAGIRKTCPIIAGGIHPTLCPDEVLANPLIDAVCIGEAENVIENIANLDFVDTLNVWYKKNGKIVKNPTGCYSNLNSDVPLRLPEFYYPTTSFIKGIEYLEASFETSRGCPYKCRYCCNDTYKKAVFGDTVPRIRRMSPSIAISHIVHARQHTNINLVRFVDENIFIAPKEWINEFFSLYSEHVNLPFILQTSVNTINPEVALLLKKAGCVTITLGFESGNEEYRKTVLGKKFTDQDFFSAVSILQDLDIRVSFGMMIGTPLQTKELLAESIRTLRKLRVPVSWDYYMPLPKSPLGDYAISEGFIPPSTGFEVYQQIGAPRYVPIGITKTELVGYARTFLLYAMLPESLHPIVKICENDTEESNRILDILELVFYF